MARVSFSMRILPSLYERIGKIWTHPKSIIGIRIESLYGTLTRISGPPREGTLADKYKTLKRGLAKFKLPGIDTKLLGDPIFKAKVMTKMILGKK